MNRARAEEHSPHGSGEFAVADARAVRNVMTDLTRAVERLADALERIEPHFRATRSVPPAAPEVIAGRLSRLGTALAVIEMDHVDGWLEVENDGGATVQLRLRSGVAVRALLDGVATDVETAMGAALGWDSGRFRLVETPDPP